MAEYPSIPYSDRESDSQRVARRKVLITRSQRVRSQVMGDVALVRFKLVHDLITAAERDTLEAHYADHETIEFPFVWRDGRSYLVQYDEQEMQVSHVRGKWWRVETQLIGRRQ